MGGYTTCGRIGLAYVRSVNYTEVI
jgi:hypothetical protein